MNVGTDHNTSAFAAASIRRWWQARGRHDYPEASRLLITADAGGSNSYRYRLWKAELAAFLNTIIASTTRTGLRVEAALDQSSYPTGIAVSHDQLQALPITAHTDHGQWNTASPRSAALPRHRTPTNVAAARTRALQMLADPRLTGMTTGELDALRARLAPDQQARAEQHRYVLRGGRRVATTGRSRSLLSDADEVLLTVVYLRQVCPQKVLCDLLGINPVTTGQAIKATRQLLDQRKISITPTVVRYFARAEDLRTWATGTGPAEHTPTTPTHQALTDPTLTGMSRAALHTLLEELIVPYAAAIGQRRHLQRGGDRRPGTRGGVFRQKITDGNRILATILYRRCLCNLNILAELFSVSPSTLWNAIRDVEPILDAHHIMILTAERRFITAQELLGPAAPE